jgi:hypothetical protein
MDGSNAAKIGGSARVRVTIGYRKIITEMKISPKMVE